MSSVRATFSLEIAGRAGVTANEVQKCLSHTKALRLAADRTLRSSLIGRARLPSLGSQRFKRFAFNALSVLRRLNLHIVQCTAVRTSHLEGARSARIRNMLVLGAVAHPGRRSGGRPAATFEASGRCTSRARAFAIFRAAKLSDIIRQDWHGVSTLVHA